MLFGIYYCDWGLKSGYGEAIITSEKKVLRRKINLQRDDGKAKAYQVRQVRAIILRYKMGGDI